MRYFLSLFFFLFFLNINYAQVSYCDSINILINNQSLTSVTCTSNTNGMNTFWNSQDWVLTDENGTVIANVSGSMATFSMPNPMNSDTNLICVTSILSSPVLTIACNTCDTLVWDGVNWVLLSMINTNSCIDSSLIDTLCMCPMIYAPVCACNGIVYSNSCLATCDGNTIIGPVDPTLVPGQPCSLTPNCVVEINNGTVDIEICDGDTAILEATNGFDTYSWALNGSTGALLGTTHVILATNPGIYTVVVTDSVNNCVDIDSIEVVMYPVTLLNPVTVPSPPMICFGDSLVIEVNTGFIGYWWNTGNPNDTDQDRVVVYPTQDFTYVVEALDMNGCEAREEIEVFVDTCNNTELINLFFEEVVIYPNPTNSFVVIDLPTSEKIDVLVYSVTGQLISDFRKVSNNLVITETVLSKGTYILHLIHRNGVMIDKIIVQ